MIILAMITYSLPFISGNPDAEVRHAGVGLWAFWLMVTGITGMTLSFGAAGLGQVYLERIMGLGYLDAQERIQVHFQMLLGTAFIFTVGVFLFLVDFFVLNAKRGIILATPAGEAERPTAAPRA
jgi:nitric oxide reductase subunit B